MSCSGSTDLTISSKRSARVSNHTLTEPVCQADNHVVARHVASAVVAFVLTLAVAAVGWADCGSEWDADAQMNCCAMMHHQCGKGNADDCCNKMRGASPSSNVATAAVVKVSVPAVFVALDVRSAAAVAPPPTNGASWDVTIIRPHDPPHLHPFPLLI